MAVEKSSVVVKKQAWMMKQIFFLNERIKLETIKARRLGKTHWFDVCSDFGFHILKEDRSNSGVRVAWWWQQLMLALVSGLCWRRLAVDGCCSWSLEVDMSIKGVVPSHAIRPISCVLHALTLAMFLHRSPTSLSIITRLVVNITGSFLSDFRVSYAFRDASGAAPNFRPAAVWGLHDLMFACISY